MFTLRLIDKSLKKALYLFVRVYQIFLSPLIPSRCRFYPSCSAYSLEALERKNFLISIKLILFRIFKCHPLSKGGYDPVK